MADNQGDMPNQHDDIANGDAAASVLLPATPQVGEVESGEVVACTLPTTLPPGYMLVTVTLEGQAQPAVDSLPVEVLPCHTFADVCSAALARVPHAPQDYDLQGFLVLESLEVPLQNPHTPARDTLRTFPGAMCLRFAVGPPSGRAGPRTVRVSRLEPRRQSRWPRRLARIAIGVAKLVLAVEAAALLRGGSFSTLRALRRAAGWGASADGGSDGSGSGLGEETEAGLDAVAEYLAGRADLRSLQRFDPQLVLSALEAMDTEVLEQMDVPNVEEAKVAVRSLLRQVRESRDAAAAAEASSSGRPDTGSAGGHDVSAGSGAVEAPRPSRSGAEGAGDAGTAAGAAVEQAPAKEASASPEPLPGFGPATPTSTSSSRGERRR